MEKLKASWKKLKATCKRKRKNLKASWKKYWILYLMLLPAAVWYVLFMFKPLYYLLISFFDYNIYQGFPGSTFVGFKNFIEFFSGKDFARTLKNTVMLNVWSLLIEFPVAIIFAVLLNEIRNKTAKKFFQTVSFIPYFISVVVISGIFINLLSPSTGIINIMRAQLGLDRIYYIAKSEYFRPIYVLLNIWKSTGYSALVYIAALTAINTELYESGQIDGANKWQKVWYITLPSIIPTIMIMLVLRIGSLMQAGYETVLLLYQPATYETADIITTYAYRVGLEQNNFGLGSAASLFNSIVSLVLILLANKLSKRMTETSLW